MPSWCFTAPSGPTSPRTPIMYSIEVMSRFTPFFPVMVLITWISIGLFTIVSFNIKNNCWTARSLFPLYASAAARLSSGLIELNSLRTDSIIALWAGPTSAKTLTSTNISLNLLTTALATSLWAREFTAICFKAFQAANASVGGISSE